MAAPNAATSAALASLMNTSKYSDLTLVCDDGTEFHVHRAIVCPRSRVIEAACHGQWIVSEPPALNMDKAYGLIEANKSISRNPERAESPSWKRSPRLCNAWFLTCTLVTTILARRARAWSTPIHLHSFPNSQRTRKVSQGVRQRVVEITADSIA